LVQDSRACSLYNRGQIFPLVDVHALQMEGPSFRKDP
jgi:hypothetical protein